MVPCRERQARATKSKSTKNVQDKSKRIQVLLLPGTDRNLGKGQSPLVMYPEAVQNSGEEQR